MGGACSSRVRQPRPQPAGTASCPWPPCPTPLRLLPVGQFLGGLSFGGTPSCPAQSPQRQRLPPARLSSQPRGKLGRLPLTQPSSHQGPSGQVPIPVSSGPSPHWPLGATSAGSRPRSAGAVPRPGSRPAQHPTLELTRRRGVMLQGLGSPLGRADGGPQPPRHRSGLPPRAGLPRTTPRHLPPAPQPPSQHSQLPSACLG